MSQGRGMSTDTSKEHKAPHERPNGPWDDWELEDGARHLGHAENIARNPKYLEAIKGHAEKKAQHHHHIAHRAGMLARAGHISPKAMAKIKDE